MLKSISHCETDIMAEQLDLCVLLTVLAESP